MEFICLYYSLFFPCLTYCNEMLGNTYKLNLRLLFLWQKVICIMSNEKYLEQTDVFKALNTLPLFLLI